MWVLREIVERGGEVGFREFMELALYHPVHGYYTSAESPWGRSGDYLTAPSASAWYGATVSRFLGELAGAAGVRLRLVELAAGDGSFLAALFDGLGERGENVLAWVRAVDRSAVMRERIARRLAGAPVTVEVASGLPSSRGKPVVVHACELYDAMPVNLVEQTAEGMFELTVAVAGDCLEWRRKPAGDELVGYFSGHGVELDEGQHAEVNLEAETFHRRVLEAAGEGIALVLDYGYEAERLYHSRGRRHGSLVSYRRHRVGRDLLDSPGEQDLTAHVNWDDLRRAAAGCGWEEIALMPLAEFLVRAGLGDLVEARGLGIEAELDAETVAARQEIKRLLDPGGMGSDLKMLIQGKGDLVEPATAILSREP